MHLVLERQKRAQMGSDRLFCFLLLSRPLPRCPKVMVRNPQLPPVLGQAQAHATVKARRPLRLLTLTQFYPSGQDNTTGCSVEAPLAALAEAGLVNTVFAVRPGLRGEIQARESGVRAEWFRYLSLPGGFGLPTAGAFLFARILGKVRELQRSQRLDLIHAHAALPCGHAAMLLSAELGIPYVVSVHGLDAFSTEQVHGRAGQWCRRISQRVYQSSPRAICVSEHVRERVLEGTGQKCRTSVVYNGVDPEMFSPSSDPPLGQTVLSVGNLIPIKGHETLIRAIATLVADFPELKLEVIGEGPELGRLRDL